jgi:hypothetical protein
VRRTPKPPTKAEAKAAREAKKARSEASDQTMGSFFGRLGTLAGPVDAESGRSSLAPAAEGFGGALADRPSTPTGSGAGTPRATIHRVRPRDSPGKDQETQGGDAPRPLKKKGKTLTPFSSTRPGATRKTKLGTAVSNPRSRRRLVVGGRGKPTRSASGPIAATHTHTVDHMEDSPGGSNDGYGSGGRAGQVGKGSAGPHGDPG